MFWKAIRKTIASKSTRELALFPVICSLLPLLLLILISHGHYSGTPTQGLLIELMLFLWGSSGIPIILRREDPGIVVVRGWSAVAIGILVIVTSWGAIIYHIIFP